MLLKVTVRNGAIPRKFPHNPHRQLTCVIICLYLREIRLLVLRHLMRTSSVTTKQTAEQTAENTIDELRKRFKPEKARNLSATYLITIRGRGGGSWLTKINDGTLEFAAHEENDGETSRMADCLISVEAEDLELILSAQVSAMTAAISGVLSIEGELGLAMQLVPIFFEGQAPFI